MKIEAKKLQGNWTEYILTNDKKMAVSVLDYGGIITGIKVPDRNGTFENVVLSYKNYKDYQQNPNYFGALIGRVAGRIEGASFELDNKPYALEANEGQNHLHGGSRGFHHVVWKAVPFQTEKAVGLTLSHSSADGEDGYPGTVDIQVTYTLTNADELVLDYQASSDKATPLTLTNHTYFNLSGDLKHTVGEQSATIASSQFVELDSDLIPTGERMPVDGTPFDFRSGRLLRDGFNDEFGQNKIAGSGYDHYFIFDNTTNKKAILQDSASGRQMAIETDQPGMVLYTANGLEDGVPLKEGPSRKYLGVCFETQASPASLHHEGMPSVLLNAGEVYKKQTRFAFSSIQ